MNIKRKKEELGKRKKKGRGGEGNREGKGGEGQEKGKAKWRKNGKNAKNFCFPVSNFFANNKSLTLMNCSQNALRKI